MWGDLKVTGQLKVISLGLGGEDKKVIAGHEPCGTIVELGKTLIKIISK